MRVHGRCRFLSQLFLARNKKVKARKSYIYLYMYMYVFYFLKVAFISRFSIISKVACIGGATITQSFAETNPLLLISQECPEASCRDKTLLCQMLWKHHVYL